MRSPFVDIRPVEGLLESGTEEGLAVFDAKDRYSARQHLGHGTLSSQTSLEICRVAEVCPKVVGVLADHAI